ncbi:hypothetical protein BDR26DRAFT_857542 [Obelidium mucronatum]|nr:hypothetical protein BDR26DRAFT_857542 [Obelidium mucronatum]
MLLVVQKKSNNLEMMYDKVALLDNPYFREFSDFVAEQVRIQQKMDAMEPRPWTEIEGMPCSGVTYKPWVCNGRKEATFRGRESSDPHYLFNLWLHVILNSNASDEIGYVDDLESCLEKFEEWYETGYQWRKPRNAATMAITNADMLEHLKFNFRVSEKTSSKLFKDDPGQRQVFDAMKELKQCGDYFAFRGSSDTAKLSVSKFDDTLCPPGKSAKLLLGMFGLPKTSNGMSFCLRTIGDQISNTLNNGFPGKRLWQEEGVKREIKTEVKLEVKWEENGSYPSLAPAEARCSLAAESDKTVYELENRGIVRVKHETAFVCAEESMSRVKQEVKTENVKYSYLLPLWPVEIDRLAYNFHNDILKPRWNSQKSEPAVKSEVKVEPKVENRESSDTDSELSDVDEYSSSDESDFYILIED